MGRGRVGIQSNAHSLVKDPSVRRLGVPCRCCVNCTSLVGATHGPVCVYIYIGLVARNVAKWLKAAGREGERTEQ